MRHSARHTLTVLLIVFASACCKVETPEDFNFGWKFTLGDAPEYAAAGYDDSAWRDLHLPHDWSIEGNFSKDNPSTPSGGALPGGIGWYRKNFTVNHSAGQRVHLEFDGVFMNSSVYVNGLEIGTRPYGYSSFSYDITDALHPGENTVAVRCDNADQPNSRWYAGCGIYRNVRLLVTEAAHVAYNGIYVTTPSVDKRKASVHIEVEVDGESAESVRCTVFGPKGVRAARAEAKKDGEKWVADLTVRHPRLWSLEKRNLYSLNVCVDGAPARVQRFGIRTIEWDKDNGFFLNGKNTFMYGVCLHHDMGCLGTAVHRRALERELGILKEMGCNAIRTSHNPPAPELLDLCDEMGFLVMDEAMDMWRKKKTTYDYARFFDEWHERDVRDFMRRDRNHPCVVMWSVGNEILEQWNSDDDLIEKLPAEKANLLVNFMRSLPQYEPGDDNPNVVLAKHMVAIAKEIDTTRFVTAGLSETYPSNNLIKSGALDVLGFNYHVYDYDHLKEWYPDKPVFGSETASTFSSRGFYPQPSTLVQVQPEQWWMTYETEHHQCSSYDNTYAPWAELHEHAWMGIKTRPHMAATFVWTGFDYLGEPTPYSWPSRSSYFGLVDLAGFPKDVYYLYQSEWREDVDVLHLFPHWSWHEGDSVDLWCFYNNADEVELFLNGRSLGRSHKEGEQLRAQWLSVPWEPGCIEAVSYKNGREVARTKIESTGEPVGLKLTADRDVLAADGYDLSYITVEAVDAEGRAIPDATQMIHFSVEGAGELVGVDNGNAAGGLCLKGDRMPLFAGKALAVVRTLRGCSGDITLKASSDIGDSEITLRSR